MVDVHSKATGSIKYYYMILGDYIRTFKDKKGRDIDIYVDLYNIIAGHKGEEIGTFEFDFDFELSLEDIQVIEPFGRAGIAKEMFKEAINQHDDFSFPNYDYTMNRGRGMTSEGQMFFQYLYSQKLLTPMQRFLMDNFNVEIC